MTPETTIQCNCPRCGRVCGFKSVYAGRTARCLNCQAHFIIPERSGQSAQWLKPEPAVAEPGFYTNAFKGTLNAFAHPESRAGLVFYMALVMFHFLLGNEDLSFTLPGFRPPLVVGWAVTAITFGCFAWYSLETIVAASMDSDSLPPVEPDRGFAFFWMLCKSWYLFIVSLIVAFLPASFVSAWFEFYGVDIGWLYYAIAILCLLLWPMNLAIIALDAPLWRIFRYDLLIGAIGKTLRPYMLTAILTLIAFHVVMLGMGRFVPQDEAGIRVTLGLLGLRLAGAGMFLFAMRVIGAYCKHYADVCPELWVTTPPRMPGSD